MNLIYIIQGLTVLGLSCRSVKLFINMISDIDGIRGFFIIFKNCFLATFMSLLAFVFIDIIFFYFSADFIKA